MSSDSSFQNSQNYENSTLCFSKDSFYVPNFDVDTFLTRYKREYGLERLNNDLAIYLKVLKSSMSELINKDYADFVNLSTNLVGLDKAINDLKKPLISIKNDIDNVRNSIDKESKQLINKINEKLSIEKRRIILKMLMNWQRSLKVTNEMLLNDMKSEKLTGDHIERMAFEFRQLKHSLTFCQNDMTQNNEINKLSSTLEKIMQDLFIRSYNTNDKEQLQHVLKSYILLSKQQLAELLYQENYVKPYMDQYINDAYLETNGEKLDGVFNKILEFIDFNSQFLRLTSEIKCSGLHAASGDQPSSSFSSSNTVSDNEFEFLLNSIWSYVVESLDLNLNQIYSPANPDQFHKNYTSAINFLNKFESKCVNNLNMQLTRIRASKWYKYYIKKWPIQIYYQIRFQEIVFKFEQSLLQNRFVNSEYSNNRSLQLNDSTINYYLLKSSDIIYESLVYCWHQKCFLQCLTSQFWKLNLQLLSRYENYYKTIVEQYQVDINDDQQQQQLLANVNNDDIITFFVYLNVDLSKLSDRLPNFFDGIVAPLMRECGVKEITFLKEAFSHSINKLNTLSELINERLITIIIQQSSLHLKNTNEIPRLYRRTNREAPKQASNYVRNSIQVLDDFLNKYKQLINETQKNGYATKTIDQLCQKYYTISNDLLTSVKKMEDSLKRLKRVRADNKPNTNDSSVTSSSTTTTATTLLQSSTNSVSTVNMMSDDDKIRLQLYVDVCEFGNLCIEKFSYKGGEHYQVLFKLVEDVKNQIEIN